MADIAVKCGSIDGFLTAGISSAWKQEGGDTGRGSVTSPQILNSILENAAVFELKPVLVTTLKMAANGTDDPLQPAGERTSGLRPLKSRPEDRIASIMDNPFYKSFGLRHPRSPREVPSAPASLRTSAETDGKYAVREDLGDYRPGSGFVHKLMGRFASLELREEASISRMKNASSVEDILDRKEWHAAADASEMQHRERGRFMTNFAQNRARSVESVSRRKGSHNIPVVLRHIERNEDHPLSYVKSPRDLHIVAPDVQLGRDDIILIENPPTDNSVMEKKTEEETTGVAHPSGFISEDLIDELPKPNTVSAVRSLFESGKPLSPTGDDEGEPVFTPRDSVLTPRDQILTSRKTSLNTRDLNIMSRDTVLAGKDSNVLQHDSVSSPRESLVSPRIYKPQSPRITTDIAQRHDVSRFSWSSDLKTGCSVGDSSVSAILPVLSNTQPPVSSAAETAIESELSGTVKSSSLFQSSIGAENPVASPRSTAAVKAMPLSKPSVPARSSQPNSSGIASSGSAVPPSFTPNIKKTSPVMPVAPFKETKVDEGGDNRYLIYSKKSSAAKGLKVARLKDYGEGSNDSTLDNTKHLQASDDLKKEDDSVRKSNKLNGTHSKGQAPPIPKQRWTEERALSSRLGTNSSEGHWTDVLKPASPRIEDSQPQPVMLSPVEPAKPNKAPRTVFSSKSEEKTETTQALASSETSKMDIDDMANEDEEAEETSEPIKGIPSIIANRLKHNSQGQDIDTSETRRPGELFGVRLGKTHHGHDTVEDENEIPRKRLTPAVAAEKNDQEKNTSNLPSEIENQIASVRKRMEEQAIKNKHAGVSQIFDSSQLHKKRKEKQANKSGAAVGVPRLDLSSITAEDSSSVGSYGGYRVTPQDIKPCKIEFVGGNVSLGRSMLKKSRKEKVHIRFSITHLEDTFQYPSEENLLEDYLKQHPEEVLLMLQEQESSSSMLTESSDDVDLPETPRGGGGGGGGSLSLEVELLKSNTSLAHAGNLQSYRGKYHQDFELGSLLQMEPNEQPEPTPAVSEQVDSNTMQLVPADEEDTQTWSLDTSSDLLF